MIEAAEPAAAHQRGRPDLRVRGAIDQAGDARLDHRPETHQAGLERDVEGGAGQPVVPGAARGPAQGHDLGVGGRVAAADRPVGARPEQPPLGHHHGADRDFLPRGGRAGEAERPSHPGRIAGRVVAGRAPRGTDGAPSACPLTRRGHRRPRV